MMISSPFSLKVFSNKYFYPLSSHSSPISLSSPPPELPLSDHPGMVVLREFLNFIDAFTVIVFSLEILLKWTDDFTGFWRDVWNVFDLIVTVLVS